MKALALKHPSDELLQSWNRYELPEYQDYQSFMEAETINSYQQWLDACRKAQQTESVLLSIVTPVYNTGPLTLLECIQSMLFQTNSHWELLLVNDGSSRWVTRILLMYIKLFSDNRITVLATGKEKRGISAATNLGVQLARGQYIGFLDHDDRLALDAVQSVQETIISCDEIDILYSDRDMLTSEGKHAYHLMKPDWSPETLLSGNYLFHFVCYRKQVIEEVGGLRSEYDGSQDYDLILRSTDIQREIVHIPKILYHWRQSTHSVAQSADSKEYVFEAGLSALQDTLKRRNIPARAVENTDLWRGHYQLEFPDPLMLSSQTIIVSENSMGQQVDGNSDLIAFIQCPELSAQKNEIDKLLRWFYMDKVGIVCGKSVDENDDLLYAGAIISPSGDVVYPYQGFPQTEHGYMAVTQIARNVSLPSDSLLVIDQSLWQELGGFDLSYNSFQYQLYDFSFRAQAIGWRVVYDASAVFREAAKEVAQVEQEDKRQFLHRWDKQIKSGDRYYNPSLSYQSDCYALGCSPTRK